VHYRLAPPEGLAPARRKTRAGLIPLLQPAPQPFLMTLEPAGAAVNCFACGKAMAPVLWQAGSVRCHDCRAARAPLRADRVTFAAGGCRPSLRVVTGSPAGLEEGNRPLAA
jgi:hypothetical protein